MSAVAEPSAEYDAVRVEDRSLHLGERPQPAAEYPRGLPDQWVVLGLDHAAGGRVHERDALADETAGTRGARGSQEVARALAA